jgi:hypothetical protein
VRTLERQRDEIPACFGRFLQSTSACALQRTNKQTRAFDHSSMSSSPTVVSITTRPLVGSAMDATKTL